MKSIKLLFKMLLIATMINACIDTKKGHDTVRLGENEWQIHNLNVTAFRNGDQIVEAKTADEWKTAGEKGIPAWCYLNNDLSNAKDFGKLYNWYAIIDSRGLAPEGWEIPSLSDIKELGWILGDKRIAGRKMKSNVDWGPLGSGSNDSGFSGKPGMARAHDGAFYTTNLAGYWWTSSYLDNNSAWFFSLRATNDFLYSSAHTKADGFSVRCVKRLR